MSTLLFGVENRKSYLKQQLINLLHEICKYVRDSLDTLMGYSCMMETEPVRASSP